MSIVIFQCAKRGGETWRLREGNRGIEAGPVIRRKKSTGGRRMANGRPRRTAGGEWPMYIITMQ